MWCCTLLITTLNWILADTGTKAAIRAGAYGGTNVAFISLEAIHNSLTAASCLAAGTE
jgi:hypothetical protein